MNKYIITANGIDLDTFEGFGVSLNYQIEDILDITKRKTNFSKTIQLPGTPRNNLFFKQIFDVNIDNINFNPNLRIPAIIRIGDNDVLNGNLQLTNIVIDNKDIAYEVVVAGSLKNIINSIQDYYLSDLDFSEYDHIRSRQNIINSWDYIIQKNNNTFNASSGEGYVYPYIVNGQSSDILDKWYVYDAFPSVYLKTIIDKLFEFSEFTYTSDFFESEYFKSLIIPFVEGKLQLDEDDVNARTVVVGVDGSLPEATGNPVATGYRDILDQIILYTDGTNWIYNSSNNYSFPLNRETGSVADINFQDILSEWNFFGYTNQNMGFYDVSLRTQVVPKWFSQSGGDVRWRGNGSLEFNYSLFKISANGVFQTLDQSNGTQFYVPSNTANNPSPWYDDAAGLTINMAANNVWMEPGDRIVVRVGVNWPPTFKWRIVGETFNENQKMRLRFTMAESVGGDATSLTIKPSSNQTYGDQLIQLNQVVPKVKMKDLFLDIVKTFNLIIQDNPNKVNDLLIEPRDEFFKSKQRVLDWNKKLDNDSDVIITPMSELDANTFLYKYKRDSDYFNNEYFDETKKEYGELTINILNDFSQQQQKLELLFSPTPNANVFIQDRVAPFFCDISNNLLKPKKVNYRLLFYKGLINCEPFKILDYENTTTDFTTLNSYPYTGMWDHPTNPTEDLAFDRTDKIYWESNVYPVNNLFEKFHKYTLSYITDIIARLLEATFHLTPKDIAEFDFRDIIFLNGSYWRVNKIMDFNPAGSDSLTKVVLYKLIDVDIFNPDQITMPISNGTCPTDLQTVRSSKGELTIVSSSGQEVTSDCCNSIGGRFINGRCYFRYIGPVAPGVVDPVLPSGPIKPVRPTKYPYTSIGVVPISQKNGPIELQKNNNSFNKIGSLILGKRNYLSNDSGDALILGNDNSILTNTKNTLIIGDGISASESNALYIGNIYIDENGVINQTITSIIIDGGDDTVLPINKTNDIDLIDGGLDSVRLFGGDSYSRPIILNGDTTEDV